MDFDISAQGRGISLFSRIPLKGIWDEEANARYLAAYLPSEVSDVEFCTHVIDSCQNWYNDKFRGLRTIGNSPSDYEGLDPNAAGRSLELAADLGVDSDELVDTTLVYLYVEREISAEIRQILRIYDRGRGKIVRVRDSA